MRFVFDTLFLTALRVAFFVRKPRLHGLYWQYDGKSRLPNVALPKTDNDKWLWRKLIDHSPTFVKVSDKLAVRTWLESVGIAVRTPKVLWVGKDPRDIPDDVLVPPVVVKTNHASATNIFLTEIGMDRTEIDELARDYMARDHGVGAREWGYGEIERKLFVERFVPNMNTELKFYTFGREVKRLIAIYDALEHKTTDIWLPKGSDEFDRSPHRSVIGEGQALRPLPTWYRDALAISREIGAHFDHIRVDFLGNDTEFWLGEITAYNLSGLFGPLPPEELQLMNDAWDLKNSRLLREPQNGWRRIYAQILRRHLGD